MDIAITLEALEALETMTNYADDGIVSRNDPDYQEFYNDIDNARKIIKTLREITEEYEKLNERLGE